MLPKIERLTKSSEFSYTYNLKRSVANSLLILYVGRNKLHQEAPTRIGFVVGKKVHKRSTRRNKAKRLMREAYKDIRLKEPYLVQDWNTCIFLARPAMVDTDYAKVHSAMLDVFKKVYKKFHKIEIEKTD